MEIKKLINQLKLLQQVTKLGTNDIAKQMLTQQVALSANNIFENMPLQEIGRQLAAEMPVGVLDVTPEMLVQRLPVGALDTTMEQWSQKLVDSIPRENLSMTMQEAIRRAGAEKIDFKEKIQFFHGAKLMLDYLPEGALHMTAPQLVNHFKHRAPANILGLTLRSAGQQVADRFPQGVLQMTFGEMGQYISDRAPNFVALTPQQAYQALSAIKLQ